MTTPRRKTAAKFPDKARESSIINLERVGDRLKVYSLQNLLRNKHDYRAASPAKLGDILQPWYEKHVRKPGDKLAGITELWLANLPPKILDRSRLVGFKAGTLTVSVDSAPVRAELDALLRRGLLPRLQALTKGAVFRVKTGVNLHEITAI